MFAFGAHNLGIIDLLLVGMLVTCSNYGMVVVGMRCAIRKAGLEVLPLMHGKGATIGMMVRPFVSGKEY